MSNTRTYPSALDASTSCDKDQWLVSVVYNKETGPFLFIEGVSPKGNKKELAYFGKLSKQGKNWKLCALELNRDGLPGSLYLTYPASKQSANKILNIIDDEMNSSDYDVKGASSDEDEANTSFSISSNEADASFRPVLFNNTNEKRQLAMHRNVYAGMQLHFREVFGSELTFPKGLESFKAAAEEVVVKPALKF